MSEKYIPISEFKAKCIAMLKKVKRTGEPLVVTLRGEPLAKLTAFSPADQNKSIELGSLKESGKILGPISEVSFEDDWESLKK